MAKLKILFSIFVPLLCLFVPMANAEMSSESFRISTTVMSSGGNTMLSDNFSMVSTFGQSSPPGNTSSTNYSIDSGFWYTLILSTVGDVNGDGVVNLKDVIAALQVVTGQTPETIILQADADGDGSIGIAEVIMVLRQLGGL